MDCHKFKLSNAALATEALSPRIPERFEVLIIDLVSPLPETRYGDIYMLIIMDVATWYFELFALPQATAEAITTTLTLEVFLCFGLPKPLRFNNGTQFI